MRKRSKWVLPLIISVALLSLGLPLVYRGWEDCAAVGRSLQTLARVVFWVCTVTDAPLLLLTLALVAACLHHIRRQQSRSSCKNTDLNSSRNICYLPYPPRAPPPPPGPPPTPEAPPHPQKKRKTKDNSESGGQTRKTMASARIGCIQNRNNRTYSKPGPKTDLECATNVKRAGEQTRKLESLAKKCSLIQFPGCTAHTVESREAITTPTAVRERTVIGNSGKRPRLTRTGLTWYLTIASTTTLLTTMRNGNGTLRIPSFMDTKWSTMAMH